MSAERIRNAIRSPEPPGLDQPKPGSNWELIAERRITELESDIAAIRGSINGLIWTVIGAVALAVLNYLTGAI